MKLKCLEKLQDATIHAPLKFEFAGVPFSFTAQIKLIDEEKIGKLTTGNDATDKKTVRELLTGWNEFVDDGKEVPFSSETLEEMLVYGGIAGRLAIECVNAQYRVIEKN